MTHAQQMSLGLALQAARQAAGLSQAELARRAYVDRSLIHRIETGETCPSLDTVLGLLRALPVDAWARALARWLGITYVGPALDGEAADTHRCAVAEKWREESTEAAQAMEAILPVITRTPASWSEHERNRVRAALEQLVDLERACEYLVAVLAQAAGVDVREVYADHDRKLRARGYAR